MIRARTKATAPTAAAAAAAFGPMSAAGRAAEVEEWEVRPGGMLVQKRSPDSESAVAAAAAPVPTIRVKVKYDAAYYEIYLSSQSTFGELKKLVAERTGVHPQEQRITYKERERDSAAYLDVCGVRDKSKLVMSVDPAAHARRLLELRRAAKLERAAKAVRDVGADVDRLAGRVAEMEASVSKGKKVADTDVLNLIEQLMSQLVTLDGVDAGGDADKDAKVQVRRVQKYVETLDLVKIKNAKITSSTISQQQQKQPQPKPKSAVVTTEWEMFDSLFGPPVATPTSAVSVAAAPRTEWQLL